MFLHHVCSEYKDKHRWKILYIMRHHLLSWHQLLRPMINDYWLVYVMTATTRSTFVWKQVMTANAFNRVPIIPQVALRLSNQTNWATKEIALPNVTLDWLASWHFPTQPLPASASEPVGIRPVVWKWSTKVRSTNQNLRNQWWSNKTKRIIHVPLISRF